MLKALFHIDKSENWNMVLENLKNTVKYSDDSGKKIEIEVVANGNSVKGILKENSEFKDVITELNKAGVMFRACNNSLEKFKISKSELLDSFEVVPAGVVEIIEKQHQGFGYIRP